MPAVPKSPTSLEAPKPVDTHNGGALIFAPFSVRGSPVAWAAGRNRRLVRTVAVGPLGGADRRLVVSAIGVLRNSYTRRHEAVLHQEKNHHRTRDGHLHPVAAHPGQIRKYIRK